MSKTLKRYMSIAILTFIFGGIIIGLLGAFYVEGGVYLMAVALGELVSLAATTAIFVIGLNYSMDTSNPRKAFWGKIMYRGIICVMAAFLLGIFIFEIGLMGLVRFFSVIGFGVFAFMSACWAASNL